MEYYGEVIRPPPKSPNLSAYAERFVRSIKDEDLNRMIFIVGCCVISIAPTRDGSL